MGEVILSKEEKDALDNIHRLFHNISDEEALNLLQFTKNLSKVGEQTRLSGKKAGDSLRKVLNIIK